ncbi:MAG: hypothetical protein ACE5DK_13355, partial [Paracoccaceae bacterium]
SGIDLRQLAQAQRYPHLLPGRTQCNATAMIEPVGRRPDPAPVGPALALDLHGKQFQKPIGCCIDVSGEAREFVVQRFFGVGNGEFVVSGRKPDAILRYEMWPFSITVCITVLYRNLLLLLIIYSYNAMAPNNGWIDA